MEELRASFAQDARNGANGATPTGTDDAQRSLEDIFLTLTGGSEYLDVIPYLG